MLPRSTRLPEMKYEFPRVTRARLNEIDSKSSQIGNGTTPDPTEEEKSWLDIIKSTDPERERLRKKLSVCVIADVVEYNPEAVTVMYDSVKYTIKKPVNGFNIAKARERSMMDALEELNAQRQIVVGAVPLPKDFSGVEAEVIQVLAKVAENFFFTPYL
jgi:hypothetical protein